MPTLMTFLIGWPVWPFHSPERIRSEKAAIRSRTAWTSATTSTPSTTRVASRGMPARRAGRRAVLRDVDVLAPEHHVPALLELRLLGQLEEQPHGLVGHAVLRVVEVEPDGLHPQPLAAVRILGEQVAQVALADLRVVTLEHAAHAGRCRNGMTCSGPVMLPLLGSDRSRPQIPHWAVANTDATWSELAALAHRLSSVRTDRGGLARAASATRSGVKPNRVSSCWRHQRLRARAAVAYSTGRQEALSRAADSLRTELIEVQAQEEAARQKLDDLDRELAGLRAVAGSSAKLGDAELEQLRDECRRLGIITRNHQLLGLFRDLKKGAKSQLPALLLGEPGTGKELCARAIHQLSPRSGKPFIAVNMAAISPELFESELFGHVRGSFTGATMDRRGYFELAHHGTLFLDEIGDLRLEHQGKLLRVLQEKTFYRVGATTPTTVDVRVVAATNRDLQRGVSEGWFREDLYFRLKGLVFRLPPLQDRKDDIGLLAEHCLADQARQLGREAPKLTQEALDALLQHEWKGNVRELRQCLEQAVALAERPLLTKDDLRLQAAASVASSDRARAPKILPEPAGDAAVLDCLRLNGFDMQATAKALRWDRSTVTQRLKGLCFQALVETSGDKAQAAATLAGDPSLTRTVELKLMDYYDHLLATLQPFATVDEALLDCKKRFKNLPDRHFRSVETLVRQYFRTDPTALTGQAKGSQSLY